MDQKDRPSGGEGREDDNVKPKDTRSAAAEGPGALAGGSSTEEERAAGTARNARAAVPSDPSGVASRLRDLQRRLDALAEHVERSGRADIATTADARIIIVRTPPARPELPEPRPERAAPAPAPHRRSGLDRRDTVRDRRRRRRDRRRRLHLRSDPRPATLRVERRRSTVDRRSGRGDRRLGHDRRARQAPRVKRARRAPRILLAVALQLAFYAAVVAAIVLERG